MKITPPPGLDAARPLSGPVGGDLGGGLPGPTVVGIQGVPISGSPSDGDTIVYDFGTDTFIYTTGGGSTGIQLASITAASSAIAATEAVVVSASLPAGSIVAGNSYRITGAGVGTTGVTPGTDTFRIRIGTTTLTGTIPTSATALGVAAVTGQSFNFVAVITVRTSGGSGTVIGECVVFSANVATGRYATLNNLSATTATVALDTTVTNLLELTFQSGNAGSSNIFHVASIELLTVAASGLGIPFLARQGGNTTDWSVGGSTNYTPAAPNMQAGVTAAQTTGAGPITVTFPTAFANPPIVVATIGDATVNGNGLGVMVANVTATTFDCYPSSTPAQGSATGKVHWIAIGI